MTLGIWASNLYLLLLALFVCLDWKEGKGEGTERKNGESKRFEETEPTSSGSAFLLSYGGELYEFGTGQCCLLFTPPHAHSLCLYRHGSKVLDSLRDTTIRYKHEKIMAQRSINSY